MRSLLLAILAPLCAFTATPRFPVVFEANQGQADRAFDFLGRTPGRTVGLSSARARMTLGRAGRMSHVDMVLSGAASNLSAEPSESVRSRSNYFIGRDPGRWIRDVGHFRAVRYRDVYRGVDVLYHGASGDLEYDFVVRPGADPRTIQLRFQGQQRLSLTPEGSLRLETGAGTIIHRKPVAYQITTTGRREIASRFVGRGAAIGFDVDEYDRTRELVIDPEIVYTTYMGGSGRDEAWGLSTDRVGNIYVTGLTWSTNFPLSSPALRPAYAGSTDVFVAKFNPSGGLIYSTYLGGSDYDDVYAVLADAGGNALVVGTTASANFPVTANAIQNVNKGGFLGLDGFVTKFGPTGSEMVFSTFLGGNDDDLIFGGTLDGAGAIYVTGTTWSINYPVTNQVLQTSPRGMADGFVTKLNAGGTQIIYSTLFGGSRGESAYSVAVDGAGNAFVTGRTKSADFPTTQPAQSAHKNPSGDLNDAFLLKLNPLGQALVYSTYLGGAGEDSGGFVALDAAGSAYVCGSTSSADFPVSSAGFQRTLSGPSDGFVVKFLPDGSSHAYSTYLGGNRIDACGFITIDSGGRAWVSGVTSSGNFPTVNPVQAAFGGALDAFVAQLNPTGTALLNSTYFGGTGEDFVSGFSVDSTGNIHIAGRTDSAGLATSSAFQRSYGGGMYDAFWSKLNFAPTRPAVLTITPAAITFMGAAGSSIASQTLTITAPQGSNPAWTADVAAASAWLSVNPRSGAGSGSVSVFAMPGPLAAGSYTGSVTIVNTASAARTTVPVTLTLTPPAVQLPANGVVNAASFQGGAISPGLIVTLFGSNFGPAQLTGLRLNSAGLVDSTLADVRVLFDGFASPLIYVSGSQISAVAPYSIAGKQSVQIQVEYRGVRSNAITVPVAAAAPALFTANSSGRGAGAILNQDSSFNSPANPAPRSSVVVLYGTGEGKTTPISVDGLPANSVFPKPELPVSVTIGGVDAEVQYAGAAPGFVAGVLQVNVRIPDGAPAGDAVPVILRVGQVSSPPVTVSIAEAPPASQ